MQESDNIISVDKDKRVIFDFSYKIFSTSIKSAHSYRYASCFVSCDVCRYQDLQQKSIMFVPKCPDTKPKFDGALAMPAPNLIQNDVAAEETANHM